MRGCTNDRGKVAKRLPEFAPCVQETFVIELYAGGAPPGQPNASSYVLPQAFTPQTVDDQEGLQVTTPRSAQPSVVVESPVSAGGWLRVMVGTASIQTGSFTHTQITSTSSFTWQLQRISIYS
jgi:hypothetical protein